MILTCYAEQPVRDRWTPERAYWLCLSPTDETIAYACEDHVMELESDGWDCARIQTEGQRVREQEWAGVGVN